MKEPLELLKTDLRGRVQTPRARREELVTGFAQSGLSGMAYAKLCGVNYSTFAGWLQRKRHAERRRFVDIYGTGIVEVRGSGAATSMTAMRRLPVFWWCAGLLPRHPG